MFVDLLGYSFCLSPYNSGRLDWTISIMTGPQNMTGCVRRPRSLPAGSFDRHLKICPAAGVARDPSRRKSKVLLQRRNRQTVWSLPTFFFLEEGREGPCIAAHSTAVGADSSLCCILWVVSSLPTTSMSVDCLGGSTACCRGVVTRQLR